MIRSAKMNATTPPKLIPPFHSTAASGTLPIEQTKLSTEMTGPISGPHNLAASGWPVRKKVLPERVRHPGADGPGDQQPDHDVAEDRGPLHHEDVLTEVKPVPASTAAASKLALRLDAHVHGGVPLHRPGQSLVRLLARAASMSSRARTAGTSTATSDDHDRAADELGQGELPAQQQRHDDAQLDDEVGRGDLEGHRRGEVAPLRNSDRASATAAYEHDDEAAPRPGRQRQRARPVVAEQPDDRLPPDHRLHHRRQREPQDQRPEDLPGHRAGHGQGVTDRVKRWHRGPRGEAMLSSWRRQCSSSGCGKPSDSR